jgi:endonuclease/exonuclease/phosphatase (EEP) superfamily protein YafD
MDSRPRLKQHLPGAQDFVPLYTALFTLWVLLRILFFDRFWPLALVNTFAEYLFAPLPLLVLAAVLKRNWRLLVPLLIPSLTFTVVFGELFLPRPADYSTRRLPDHLTIAIMSFNVLWSNTDYPAIAASVRAASPDIVGFQELHPENFNGVVRELEAEYPYHTSIPPEPSGGVGLFSRYPIESAEPFPLPPRNLSLHAIVDLDGQPVHVFVVHLSANNFGLFPLDQFAALASDRYASRAAEAAQLETIIAPIPEPVIMLCDCNLTDTSQAYTQIGSFLTDSFRETGWGFGHTLIHPPYHFRTQRLDYVWHNTAFAATESIVGQDGGSDHLPVITKLSLSNSP